MDLNKLLRPSSIAVIGANDKNGFGKSTCTNLLHSPLQEHIYFVNPNRTELFGKKCYASITDVPETVDMSIIILNKKLAGKALEKPLLQDVKQQLFMPVAMGKLAINKVKKNFAEFADSMTWQSWEQIVLDLSTT